MTDKFKTLILDKTFIKIVTELIIENKKNAVLPIEGYNFKSNSIDDLNDLLSVDDVEKNTLENVEKWEKQ